ncbi:phosphate propanoyltransferase [Vagococcus fluvialis]|uniref:Phosphate propanoyltransferase n=1 Tax=Vagococcus fluvialis TaxID=2738 RepID=A0A7X6DAJ9_9ENTE|nr:phosphate propanoyltransferase [Vagococcus fluvialis]MCM2139690.1 phosphate propanoyltransferase [Vagococcus fluvialis]MDT2780579.1 phosphate propanoyltransferase [Vagococcus fluvialis]NKC58865.1 phosphate propanoyltransferase [Vagococcus fluvialis]NKC68836.1 phosphate propanoyltransferase [Vagococcus fluvialis]NKD49619.1 phosphate propanoyltransferase [Vagococcus fluvialis]
MANYEELLECIINEIKHNKSNKIVPVGISNRHIHLSQQAVIKLFGEGYELTQLKPLSQTGQFACKECVTLCGPKGVIEKVRVLGPVRQETQVEILMSDTFKLGVPGKVRMSGDIRNTPGLTLIGPKGSLELEEGVIVASRHIHMSEEEAAAFNVIDKEEVSLKVPGIRGGLLDHVMIRVDKSFKLECHLDTDEANAMGITPGLNLEIIKK